MTQYSLPDSLQGKRYYIPSDQGYEKQIIARLKSWWQGKRKAGQTEQGREE